MNNFEDFEEMNEYIRNNIENIPNIAFVWYCFSIENIIRFLDKECNNGNNIS